MTELNIIRSKIAHLFDTNPNIHINVSISRPKVSLQKVEAKITGVYPYLFQITENSTGVPKSHTIQYVEVLTQKVSIVELQ